MEVSNDCSMVADQAPAIVSSVWGRCTPTCNSNFREQPGSSRPATPARRWAGQPFITPQPRSSSDAYKGYKDYKGYKKKPPVKKCNAGLLGRIHAHGRPTSWLSGRLTCECTHGGPFQALRSLTSRCAVGSGTPALCRATSHIAQACRGS